MNYLGLDSNKMKSTANELNTLLSCYHVYYQNLRNFHWNISGHHFFTLHAQFEDMYNDAKVKVDQIAERILTLGFRPMSNLSDYLNHSKLDEAGSITGEEAMVEKLLDDHAELINCMRDVVESADKVSDEGTIDLIGAFIRELEKTSWMLTAFMSKVRESA